MSEGRLRLFYADASWIAGEAARLEGEEAAHLSRVLRMKPGERCRFATEGGEEYLVELTAVSARRAEARVIERLPAGPPAPLSIRLGLPLLRGERFEGVLEKGAELGVDAFHPLALARCEARIPPGRAEARARRWSRILREAAKQSGRVPPPRVCGAAGLDSFLRETEDCPLKLLGWLGEGSLPLAGALAQAPPRPEGQTLRVALLTGPEGDLTPEEGQAARAAGFLPVGLGPRVLRADTAPLALVAILQHALGEMA